MGRWPNEPPADLDDLQADPEQVARTILLRRLEAAPRTRAQLARTLHERGVPEDVATRVLDRFVEVGLIDDLAFAQAWVESRQSARGLAPRALRAELRLKGVADDLIEQAVGAIDTDAQLAAAREVAARKARSLGGVARPAQIRRLSGALARKGYGPGLVAQVVRETLEALDGEQDPADPAGVDAEWPAGP